MSAQTTAAGFTLTSSDIAEGEPIAEMYTFNGFGCAGGNVSPALSWSGAPPGDQELRADLLRSRRADRQRLLALAGVRHPAERHPTGARRRRPEEPGGAEGRGAEPHRLSA